MQITLTGYADLISIHALREEGDFSGLCAHTIRLNFPP